MFGEREPRQGAKTKAPKAPRAPRAPKTKGREKAARRERRPLLSRWRRREPRPSPLTYGEGALLAGYSRRASHARNRAILFHLALAVLFLAWGFAFGVSAPFRMMPLIVPLPLMALLIIWLLPAGEYAPTAAIEPLFIAFFASLVLWPNYIALALPHLPWLTLLRIFAAPLVLIFLVGISVSATFRTHLKNTLTSDPVLWRMLAGFVLLQTISLGLSRDPVISLNRWIVQQTNLTTIFVVSCYVFMIPTFAERWARMFLAMVYVVCFVGLWEASLGGVLWAGHIPSLLKVDGDLVANILDGAQRKAIGLHRVQSISTQPLAMAELLGLAAPFALHIGIGRGHIVLRAVALAYLPLALLLIQLADSRLGMVALLSALLFYLLIWASLRWRQNKRSLVAPAVVLVYPVILVMSLLATFFVGRLRSEVWGSGAQATSTATRGVQWDMAMPKILTHPIGHGIGQAGKEVGFFSPSGKLTLDSYYISVLMDYGIVGFCLYFGLFLYAAWLSARVIIKQSPTGELTLLLPLTVALLQFVIIKSVLSLDANHPLVFMMLGAVVALSYRARLEHAEQERLAGQAV